MGCNFNKCPAPKEDEASSACPTSTPTLSPSLVQMQYSIRPHTPSFRMPAPTLETIHNTSKYKAMRQWVQTFKYYTLPEDAAADVRGSVAGVEGPDT